MPAAEMAQAARRGVAELDASLPIYDVAVLEQTVADATAEARVETALLGGFAGLAVLLSAVRIFGVLALEVGRRRRELAVRLALGAAPARLQRSVIRDALGLTGAGPPRGDRRPDGEHAGRVVERPYRRVPVSGAPAGSRSNQSVACSLGWLPISFRVWASWRRAFTMVRSTFSV
jgi:hypothetical protein